MKTDHLIETQDLIFVHNKVTREYHGATTDMINHLTKLRDKINFEIDRLGVLQRALLIISAENVENLKHEKSFEETMQAMENDLKTADEDTKAA